MRKFYLGISIFALAVSTFSFLYSTEALFGGVMWLIASPMWLASAIFQRKIEHNRRIIESMRLAIDQNTGAEIIHFDPR